uniref:Uncharacterized protein n=1 Tax=Trypanosoma congolense (strain IL3000) TaxID=1068625 RepID=G0UQB6_TRYCI|nr:hypothetical protein, unlikely [Trypanosoma congolense IL3000]
MELVKGIPSTLCASKRRPAGDVGTTKNTKLRNTALNSNYNLFLLLLRQVPPTIEVAKKEEERTHIEAIREKYINLSELRNSVVQGERGKWALPIISISKVKASVSGVDVREKARYYRRVGGGG